MQNRMLSEYRLFAGLSEEECQAVLGCIGGWESPAQKGELLAHAGEELAAMGLVLEGRVDILSTDYWGSETLMARLGPGELFGEVFAGQGVELPYDLVAAEDCRILWLRPDRLMTGCCEACGFPLGPGPGSGECQFRAGVHPAAAGGLSGSGPQCHDGGTGQNAEGGDSPGGAAADHPADPAGQSPGIKTDRPRV